LGPLGQVRPLRPPKKLILFRFCCENLEKKTQNETRQERVMMIPILFYFVLLFFCSFVLLFFCSFVLSFFCSFVLLFFCCFLSFFFFLFLSSLTLQNKTNQKTKQNKPKKQNKTNQTKKQTNPKNKTNPKQRNERPRGVSSRAARAQRKAGPALARRRYR
jgi:Ca2+/Na+ antiporter